jgi:hypothetical protein
MEAGRAEPVFLQLLIGAVVQLINRPPSAVGAASGLKESGRSFRSRSCGAAAGEIDRKVYLKAWIVGFETAVFSL